ncbi:MAG TPA: isoprenoid biosynthesis protein ElbB [Chlorobaculum sp.]|jgi:enhancing lycopene biosynthesis protein 2|uniref:Es1 family protein n=1 Tax=Chlorobaculum tepidum (strain ATCC 49652 / DSM 12025 / NBRC 103806 / TLS) TaxID=194439 RepID=Q8KBV2_CHLTE|nr:isoprenoid biosynthesis glyoxalase ElbB [Chlorobaculum tepidum]AAM72905.1 es1 family protein [Chlorobaculum tepidum TLS]HBU22533.1 isoprenoid biosynthesis protein ElbB [Chlorobaculum sp.]
MKKIGVILSGCGVYDGTEIHEAVLTLLALDKAQAKAVCFAPDIAQRHVVNHLTGEISENETRNVLVESARIARGSIRNLRDIDTMILDGLIIPGGYGAAKNLSDYAVTGANCEVLPEVADAVMRFRKRGKPLGFLCIAPVIAAKLFGSEGVEVTIGSDEQTAADIAAMGAKHVPAAVEEIIVSPDAKIVTTPAYMLGPGISDIAKGIDKLVAKVLELA